jgi:hypothetical protein
MAEEPKTHGWWQTVPGILTTIAGIITGLTGLIVALQQPGVFQKKPESQVSRNEPVDLCQQLGGYAIYPGLFISLTIDRRTYFWSQAKPQNNRIPGSAHSPNQVVRSS